MNIFKIQTTLGLCLVLFLATFASANLVNSLQDRSSLESAKSNPGGAVVYFGKTKIPRVPSAADHEIKAFMKNFNKAAKTLKDYAISFFMVDCAAKVTEFDAECESGNKVIAYSNGEKQEMNLQQLFDEHHIVGHVLFNVLKDEVVIAQDKYMWEDIVGRSKGKKDIILAYVRGIGEEDQRYFMEAAFVYGKEFQFVLSTERSMPGVTEDGSLWYYYCKNATPSEGCEFKLKKSQPTNVLDVVRFLKLQGSNRITKMNADGSSFLDKSDFSFPVSKVYLFDKDVALISDIALDVLDKVDDSFYFILVDVDQHKDLIEKFGIHDSSMLPNLVLQPSHLVDSKEKYYEQMSMDVEFKPKDIAVLLNQYHKDPNVVYKSVVEIVNIAYDHVDTWKKPTKGIWLIGGCMEELTECIHFRILFRRLARTITHAPMELDFSISYVDFTKSPDNAKLNTLPGIQIIKGEEEIKYQGLMDYDLLLQFLKENLSSQISGLPLSGSDHMPLEELQVSEEPEESDEETGQSDLLAMEEDSMSKAAVNTLKTIDDANVTALTDKTFNTTKDKHDLMVTLFYLPWCVKSILLRGPYAEVVKDIEESTSMAKISTSLNRVNCFDWEDVCRKQGIFTYPVIVVYRNGFEPITYSGSLDIETLKNTIQMYQDPIVQQLTDHESLKQFSLLQHPSTQLSYASVLGLFNTENDHELATFKNVALEMFGKHSFAFATGSIAKQSAESMKTGLPSFIILKRGDPVGSMVNRDDFNHMKNFVKDNILPTYGELTAINFPKYIAFKKPFIIHFKNKNDASMEATLKALSTKTQTVFVTWMDMEKAVTRDIMASYMKDSVDSALVLLDHKQGTVYKYEGENKVAELLEWVSNYLGNLVEPTAALSNNEWKPLREGYNYLQIIEDSARNKISNEMPAEEEATNGFADIESSLPQGDAQIRDEL